MARAPAEAMEPKPAPAYALSVDAKLPQMTVYIANSILTNAALTREQLESARLAYLDAARLLQNLGPRFANARRDAVDMHNRVVRWINGARDEEKRRKTIEEEDRLVELVP